MKIEKLRVNHLINPIGYDFQTLTLSWGFTETQGRFIVGLQVIIALDETMQQIVYDSGYREYYRNNWMTIPNFCCKSCTRYYWTVRAEDDLGNHVVAQVAYFESAFQNEEFQGEWISATPESTTRMPILFKDFVLQQMPVKARLYAYGAGVYEARLNGEKVSDEVLLPGYHSYDLRLEYQTFDVTSYLSTGNNRLSFLLGEGWYKGRFGFDGNYTNLYGNRKKCIAQLMLEYESGEQQWIRTDKSWQAVESTVGENGIYDGESIDCLAECSKLQVEVLKDSRELLVPRTGLPIRKTEYLQPIDIRNEDDGSYILDFGESITGWVEFAGNFKSGQTIRLSYGEVLQDGKFYRDNLRTAKAEFTYISDGSGKWIRPHFTYYGFRYVKVEGCDNADILTFIAYRIMSDIEQSGSIVTSNEKVNRLFENTVRSQKCNFLDIPTDCPQRDERMGWTGDVAIFAGTACFHMEGAAFFRHYTKSLFAEQGLRHGGIPFFSPLPKVPHEEKTNPFYLDNASALWGDVAVILPWTLYRYYGDKDLLEEQYPGMRDWVEYVRRRVEENPVPYLWQNDRQLGDWLALDNGNIYNPIGRTDTGFLASLYFYQSVVMLAHVAGVLCRTEEKEYQALAYRIKEAFCSYYFTEKFELTVEETQTAYALLLQTGLYPEGAEQKLADRLKELLEENNGHLNTGFAGTPALCPALSEHGYTEKAYDLLLNEDYPGWLHEVNMGATTVWERWNSLEEDGKISGTGMNSLNHYAYGSIAEWMYRYMCGFRPSMGEDVKMSICPVPDKRFSHVIGSWDSPMGKYVCEWFYDEKQGFRYRIEVPFNANAKIIMPDGSCRILESGTYYFDHCTMKNGSSCVKARIE